jgi:SAM-dependent methyltransferase
MPDFVRANRNLRNGVAELGFHLFDLAAYEVLYRMSPARKELFFNGGYLPLAPDFLIDAAYANEPHAAMMYHLVGASNIASLKPNPRQILDIGCGQGGGIYYLNKLYPDAMCVGTERSRGAVRLARHNLAGISHASVDRATGDTLNYDTAKFDMVISVGAPTYIGLTRFVSETARVSKPNAIISFSGGYRQGDHKKIEAEISAASEEYGCELLSYDDITPHTFASLKADIPRREEALKRVIWPFRLYDERWADMPGSPEYAEYENGQRADFAAVMRRKE